MITLAELVVKLLADADGYSKTFDAAEEKASGLGSHIGGIAGTIGKVLGGALLAGGTALLGGLTASVAAAADAEKGVAQLEAVLRSTGGAVGMTKDQLLGLASGLQKVTTFEDDAVVGAENVLLTFTNIGRDVFPQATKTVLDMSQALGQDLKSSSIQLGKALNDPIAGITALSRVGVTFTDSQKDMIKRMTEAGDVMGAQKMILAELNREFGGSAEAAGNTFTGQWEIFKNSLGDIAEEIGGRVLPLITPLISNVKDLAIAALPQVSAALDVVVPAIRDGLGAAFAWIVATWPIVKSTVIGVFDAVKAWVDTNIMPTINGVLIPAFNSAVQWVLDHWPIVRDTVIGVFESIKGWVLTTLVPLFTGTIMPVFWQVIDIVAARWPAIRDTVVGTFEAVLTWVTANWPIVRDVIVGAFNTALDWINTNVVPFFNDTLIPLFQTVVEWVQMNWPIVRDQVIDIFNRVISFVDSKVTPFFNNTVLPLFQSVVGWFQEHWGKIGDKASEIFSEVIKYVENKVMPFITGTLIPLFQRVVDWVATNWPIIYNKISEVFGGITGFVTGTLVPFFNGTLLPIIKSVVEWVQANWPYVKSTVEWVFRTIESIYNTVFKPVIDFIIFQFAKVLTWVQDNWPLIQKTINTVISWFNTDGKNGLNTFSNVVKTIFETIKNTVGTALDIVLGIVKLAMQLINGDTAGAGETLKKVFADICWGALNIVTGILNIIIEVVRGAIVNIVDMIAGAGTAKKLAEALGGDITKKIDILGTLNVTKQGLYDFLGVGGPDTSGVGQASDAYTAGANQQRQGLQQTVVNNFNVTTKDDPEAIATATARELRLQQAWSYAP